MHRDSYNSLVGGIPRCRHEDKDHVELAGTNDPSTGPRNAVLCLNQVVMDTSQGDAP